VDAAALVAESEWRTQLAEQFGSVDDAEGNNNALSILSTQVAALSRQVATLSDSLQPASGAK